MTYEKEEEDAPSTSRVERWQQNKIKFAKQGIYSILSSVKWMFFAILAIAYIVAYSGQIPTQEIQTLSIVGWGTIAVGAIIIFVILETKFIRRRNTEQEKRITNLEKHYSTDTRMLKGTIRSLELHTDQATFELNSEDYLIINANDNFMREFGWTIISLNRLLVRHKKEDRINELVKLLVRKEYRNDIAHLMINRLENGYNESAVRKDLWLTRKDMSDFSADLIIEVIRNGNLKIKGFIKNTEEEKHRQATEESVVGLMVLLRDHFSEQKQQDSVKTRKAMVEHLDKMRQTHDGKLR